MSRYTLEEIREITNSKLIGNPNYEITGVDDLETASSSELSFLHNPLYQNKLYASQAGAVIISSDFTNFKNESNKQYLVHPNPSIAFQKVIELFIHPSSSGFSGIHPTAVIHEEACLDQEVDIGPHVTIDRGAIIGKNTVIGANVSIGTNTIVGANCILYPNVVIRENCTIGNRVILQPGAIIGSCGFGFFTDAKGNNHKLKQLGRVIIEDDVEIGANSTIDRARFKATIIGRGTKIDNLVQIAHQVEIGNNNLIAAQVGIAGSTKTGSSVIFGGQVGITGHISIADGAVFAARSAVSKTIKKRGVYSGVPAIPIKDAHRQYVSLKSICQLTQRIKDLETDLKKLQDEKSLR
ncbi:MAG: UDP-3-O-(3-hydroxymyristoyl)glucosamine N-acyltransferase [Chlamydiales bacterium]